MVVLLRATIPLLLFGEVFKQLKLSDFAIENAQWVKCVNAVPI